MSNLDDQGIAQSLRIGSADTIRQHIKNIADKFNIPSDISDKNFRRRELVKLFRQYSPESVSAKHKHDENWSGFSESSDRPQPPTPQNISTAPVTDNLTIPSDQEELEIDGSISSWVSEKSYNKFIARDFDLKKLIEYTENGISSKVLSIWGMGGLGKTATCHRLISLLDHQKRFKEIINRKVNIVPKHKTQINKDKDEKKKLHELVFNNTKLSSDNQFLKPFKDKSLTVFSPISIHDKINGRSYFGNLAYIKPFNMK